MQSILGARSRRIAGALAWLTGALVVGHVSARAIRYAVGSGSQHLEPILVRDWEEYLGAQDMRLGLSSAKVVIIEFTDFQCAYCRTLHERLLALRNEFGDSIVVVSRNFPLPSHSDALGGAAAAQCAAFQGRFPQMADILFRHQDEQETRAWTSFAKMAGLRDTAAFEACMTSPRVAALISADVNAGRQLNVMGTPTVLINGLRVRESLSLDLLRRLVRSQLDKSLPRGQTETI